MNPNYVNAKVDVRETRMGEFTLAPVEGVAAEYDAAGRAGPNRWALLRGKVARYRFDAHVCRIGSRVVCVLDSDHRGWYAWRVTREWSDPVTGQPMYETAKHTSAIGKTRADALGYFGPTIRVRSLS